MMSKRSLRRAAGLSSWARSCRWSTACLRRSSSEWRPRFHTTRACPSAASRSGQTSRHGSWRWRASRPIETSPPISTHTATISRRRLAAVKYRARKHRRSPTALMVRMDVRGGCPFLRSMKSRSRLAGLVKTRTPPSVRLLSVLSPTTRLSCDSQLAQAAALASRPSPRLSRIPVRECLRRAYRKWTLRSVTQSTRFSSALTMHSPNRARASNRPL
mmetsp:Transcript_14415/g.44189  ORF Transcript_14415/g.44189 Transcript_14415/m.44189 type:complete len:216 (+) Transcript_14415:733-1380(+)